MKMKVPVPKPLNDDDQGTLGEIDKSCCLYIPASPEMLEALEVGNEAQVTVRGKILSKREVDDDEKRWSGNEFEIQLSEVEVKDTGEFAELLDDEE